MFIAGRDVSYSEDVFLGEDVASSILATSSKVSGLDEKIYVCSFSKSDEGKRISPSLNPKDRKTDEHGISYYCYVLFR